MKKHDPRDDYIVIPPELYEMLPEMGADGMAVFLCLEHHSSALGESKAPEYETIMSETSLTWERVDAGIQRLLGLFPDLERILKR